MLIDYRLPPKAAGKPKQVVIFLHGVGDSGSGGLLTIGQLWQDALPECEFLCPDAPFPYDMAPEDFGGRQWFSLQSREPDRIMKGVEKAAPILNDYIDHVLRSREITIDKLALVGFSQGTFMSLYVAPRRPEPMAAVIGYSGMLPGGATLVAEKKSSPPVLLIHGEQDEVVSFAAMSEAERTLRAAKIDVRAVNLPGLGHTIDDRGIGIGLEFLHARLS